MAKKTKANLEFLLVKAEVKGIPEKGLLRSRNIGQVDLIWPRTGVAKKSGAREMVFKRGACKIRGARPRGEVHFRCYFVVIWQDMEFADGQALAAECRKFR